jgi:hypothetical protein
MPSWALASWAGHCLLHRITRKNSRVEAPGHGGRFRRERPRRHDAATASRRSGRGAWRLTGAALKGGVVGARRCRDDVTLSMDGRALGVAARRRQLRVAAGGAAVRRGCTERGRQLRERQWQQLHACSGRQRNGGLLALAASAADGATHSGEAVSCRCRPVPAKIIWAMAQAQKKVGGPNFCDW